MPLTEEEADKLRARYAELEARRNAIGAEMNLVRIALEGGTETQAEIDAIRAKVQQRINADPETVVKER